MHKIRINYIFCSVYDKINSLENDIEMVSMAKRTEAASVALK